MSLPEATHVEEQYAPELPPEVWSVVAHYLGDHTHGFVDRCALARVHRCAAVIPKLPCTEGTVDIDLSIVSHASNLAMSQYRVYDIDSQSTVSIATKALAKTFSHPLNKSLHIYPPMRAYVWLPKGGNVFVCKSGVAPCTVADVTFHTCVPDQGTIDKFRISDFTGLTRTGDEPICLRDQSRTRKTQGNAAAKMQSLIACIVASMRTETRVTALKISQHNLQCLPYLLDFSELAQALPTWIGLRRLCLSNTPVKVADVGLIADNAARLEHLDLSNSVDVESYEDDATRAAFKKIAKLVVKWRQATQTADASLTRKLVLDGCNPGATNAGRRNLPMVGITALTDLVHGLAHPNYLETMHAVTDESYEHEGVYLSVDMCNHDFWMTAVAHAPNACLNDGPGVLVKMAQIAQVNETKEQKKKQKIHAATAPREMPRPHTYTNVLRERDRYKWQDADYTCKSCGVVWPKHSVTVSWRQTCVSECLKGKRSCVSRNEYAQVQAGNLWLTTKHVVGNELGNGLTPVPADVLDAEAKGLTVAVDPTTGNYVFTSIAA